MQYSDILLDQELLCEIAERCVAPKEKKDLSGETPVSSLTQLFEKDPLGSADTDIASVLDGSSLYRVISYDPDTGRIQIEKKSNMNITHVLDITELDKQIWQALMKQTDSAQKKKREQLHAAMGGSFLAVIRKIDSRLLEKSISDEDISDFQGYVDLFRADASPFAFVDAASEEAADTEAAASITST